MIFIDLLSIRKICKRYECYTYHFRRELKFLILNIVLKVLFLFLVVFKSVHVARSATWTDGAKKTARMRIHDQILSPVSSLIVLTKCNCSLGCLEFFIKRA